MSIHNMFSWKNKKNVDTFGWKKAPFLELWHYIHKSLNSLEAPHWGTSNGFTHVFVQNYEKISIFLDWKSILSRAMYSTIFTQHIQAGNRSSMIWVYVIYSGIYVQIFRMKYGKSTWSKKKQEMKTKHSHEMFMETGFGLTQEAAQSNSTVTILIALSIATGRPVQTV